MRRYVEEEGQNVVVVGQVLAADINIGYEDIVNTMVKGFNGGGLYKLNPVGPTARKHPVITIETIK